LTGQGNTSAGHSVLRQQGSVDLLLLLLLLGMHLLLLLLLMLLLCLLLLVVLLLLLLFQGGRWCSRNYGGVYDITNDRLLNVLRNCDRCCGSVVQVIRILGGFAEAFDL